MNMSAAFTILRRPILVILCCCLFSFTVAAQSDEQSWSVWLYDSHSGRAWLVGADGTVLSEQSDLLQPGELIDFFPRLGSDIWQFPNIAVSTTGRYFVYDSESELRVRDTYTGEEIFHYGPIRGFDTFTYSWIRRLFNENDTLLAYGINRSDYQTLSGGWEILVFDLATGSIIARLIDTDPAAQAVELPGFNHVPIIQQFIDGQVSFFLFPDGMESGPTYAGWTWNIETGALRANPIYTTHSTDYFAPTREVVFPAHNSHFGNWTCTGECQPFIHLNTIQLYDPAKDKAFPLYHSATLNFWGVHFIQNGEKVLTQAIPFEFDASPIWHLIGRDGTLIADVSDLHIASIGGVPDGMIYTQDDSPDLLFINTRDGLSEPRLIWSNPDGSTPLILWVSEPSTDTKPHPP